MMCSGAYASLRQDTDYAGAGGGQEFIGAVHYSGYGCPDIGVRTSRFEGRYIWLGPRGRRGGVRRLQQTLKPPQGSSLVLEPVIFV